MKCGDLRNNTRGVRGETLNLSQVLHLLWLWRSMKVGKLNYEIYIQEDFLVTLGFGLVWENMTKFQNAPCLYNTEAKLLKTTLAVYT